MAGEELPKVSFSGVVGYPHKHRFGKKGDHKDEPEDPQEIYVGEVHCMFIGSFVTTVCAGCTKTTRRSDVEVSCEAW